MGAEDIVAAIEQNFVLVDAQGNWYAISNIGQQWISRLLGKKVKVEGDLADSSRSIKVRQGLDARRRQVETHLQPRDPA